MIHVVHSKSPKLAHFSQYLGRYPTNDTCDVVLQSSNSVWLVPSLQSLHVPLLSMNSLVGSNRTKDGHQGQRHNVRLIARPNRLSIRLCYRISVTGCIVSSGIDSDYSSNQLLQIYLLTDPFSLIRTGASLFISLPMMKQVRQSGHF